jgi:DNA-binding MarR family transcriptional regulator
VPTPPAGTDSLAADLARSVGRLRRSLNREVRAGAAIPPLPEAQLEILRLVDRRPGLRVQDAAAELRLAPNTVSTLVHRLVDAGLVRRVADPTDGRVAHLRLSAAAEQRLRRWRDLRQEVLAARLADLDGADRLAVERALPVLERVAVWLEEGRSTEQGRAAVPSPSRPGSPGDGASAVEVRSPSRPGPPADRAPALEVRHVP